MFLDILSDSSICGPPKIYLSQSHFAMDGQSVSQTDRQTVHLAILTMSSSRTHDQILVIVKTFAVLCVMGILPVERMGLSCDRLQALNET
jgi:hypothetical protein